MSALVPNSARIGNRKERRSSSESNTASTHPAPTSKVASEVVYLQQKLRDVLAKQIVVDEKHQRDLILSRHQLRRLYDENAAYRLIVNAAQYRKRNDGKVISSNSAPSVTDAELEMFFNRITSSKRTENRLKYELNRLKQASKEEEKRERDILQSLNIFSNTVDHAAPEVAHTGNPSVALRIKKVETELNAVLGQQRVVEMITDSYRQLGQNLINESSDYANNIKALETQYVDRHREHLQMITLFQNAKYDYERTVSQRKAFADNMKNQRCLKEKLLQDRQTEVKHAILEAERYECAIADLQMELEEESQLLEQVEMARQELLKRQARQRDVDTLLANGGGGTNGSRRGSPQGNPSQSQDAEAEEQLSAYHLAIQQLLKESKTENRQQLVPFFKKELLQYQQLRAQVAVKLNRKQLLEKEVKDLRTKYDNVKVCAATTGQVAPHSSATLEAEVQSFLEEAEAELVKLVRDGENHRLLLQELGRNGNQLAHLVATYRPEITIQNMREEDPLLPIHFTALTQKLLSLADEVTRNTRLKEGEGSHHRQGIVIPPPPAVIPVVIPENNLRVAIRQRNDESELGGRRPPRKDGRFMRNKAPPIPMSSGWCNPSQLPQHFGRKGSGAVHGRRGSDFSFLSLDSSEVLISGACDSTQPATVSSDLDEKDSVSSSSSSSLEERSRRAGGVLGPADSYQSNAAMGRSLMSYTGPSTASGARRGPSSARLGGKSHHDSEASNVDDYRDAAGRRSGGGGLGRSCSSMVIGSFASMPSGAAGRKSGSGRRGRESSIASDIPLRREELKRVSWAIKKREEKRLANEERRRNEKGKDM